MIFHGGAPKLRVKLCFCTQGHLTPRVYDIKKWQMLDLWSRLGLNGWQMSNEINEVYFVWRQNKLAPSDFCLGEVSQKMVRWSERYPWRIEWAYPAINSKLFSPVVVWLSHISCRGKLLSFFSRIDTSTSTETENDVSDLLYSTSSMLRHPLYM